jgi:hypothetical protein
MTEAIVPMRSFVGVLIPVGSGDPVNLARAIGLNWMGGTGTDRVPALFARLPNLGAFDDAQALALRASNSAGVAYAISAQASAEVFDVQRFDSGLPTRGLHFDRDADEPWVMTGLPATWEADLLFSMNEEDFVGYLSDDETYSETDLQAARHAHQAHSLERLARRPPLLAASLWEWLTSHGISPERPNVTMPTEGSWSRIFR